MSVDWFERITGFREEDYASTKARLKVEGEELVSLANESRHGVGRLELPTLHELRARTADRQQSGRRTTVRNVLGDVRALHREAEFAGATFQVASQFNLLEMVSPNVSPEDGVTCRRRSNIDPPCRFNTDPGMDADRVTVGCG